MTDISVSWANNSRLHWTLNCEHLLDCYVICAKLLQLVLLLAEMFDLLFRLCGLGPETIFLYY